MATLRSLVISLLRLDGHANIAAANRHHARDPKRTLNCFRPHERLCRVPGALVDPKVTCHLSDRLAGITD